MDSFVDVKNDKPYDTIFQNSVKYILFNTPN